MRVVADDPWLAAFHAGDRAAVERCYREYCRVVAEAAARVLPAVDAETVTHEVFFRLLSESRLRQNFQGGHVGAWLARIARNQALDYLRRSRREQTGELDDTEIVDREASARMDDELEAKRLVERFRRECLPPELAGVFEARFLVQLPQREAAVRLGVHRTTLVYREHRVRALLRKFLLRIEDS